MANSELRYLVYTGLGLGREPATEFGDGRGVKWNTHDRKVRALPADKAAQILQQHPADFKEALTLEQAAVKWSIKADRMEALADKSTGVHGETYYPKGGEPVTVVVLDDETEAGIAKERKAAKKAAEADQPAKAAKKGK